MTGEPSPPVAGGATRLVVVRHGRTAWNDAGRFQGQADPPLDEVGWSQVEAAARGLLPFDAAAVVTSDLCRARQTALVVAGRLCRGAVVDARLREVDLGQWTGLDRSSAMRRFPSEYTRWLAGDDVARGGGERPDDAGRRAAAALIEHMGTVPSGGTLLAVSHGLVLQAALRLLAYAGVVDFDSDPPHLANGAWMTVAVCLPNRAGIRPRPAPRSV